LRYLPFSGAEVFELLLEKLAGDQDRGNGFSRRPEFSIYVETTFGAVIVSGA